MSVRSPGGRAAALERTAARWLVRMARAAPDHPDRGRFEAWLAQSPAHAQAYARLAEVWDAFELRPGAAYPPQAPPRSRRGVLVGLAAVGLLAGGGLLGWRHWRLQQPQEDWLTYTVPAGGVPVTQRCADGSQLMLSSGSQAQVRMSSALRAVRLLQGELMLDVVRDARRPLVVQAGQARVRVTGTRLMLACLPDDGVRVGVIEGQVMLGSADGAAELPLSAGQVARWQAGQRWLTEARAVTDAAGWARGVLAFEADPLDEVVMRLSRHSRRSLRLAPRAGALPRLTAIVQPGDVEAFIDQLPRLVRVELVRQPDGGLLLR